MADIIITVDSSQVSQGEARLNSLAKTITQAQRQANRIESAFRSVDRLFNTGKLTTQQYANAVQELNNEQEQLEQAMRGATAAAQQQNNVLARSTTTGLSAAEAARQLAEQQYMAGKATNRFGLVTQQVGYQVGDFFVQVQSGTNALVALGQQGTQLAGLLPGLTGAILGIGLSIATAFGQMSMRSQDMSFSLSAMAEDFRSALEPIRPLVEAISSSVTYMASTASSALGLLLDNFDRLVVYAGTAATVFAGSYVASMIAAAVATATLSGALLFLRTALIRTGVGALIVGAGELVYQFTRLVEAAGGFGEAMALLKDVGVEVFDRIAKAFNLIPLAVTAGSAKMKEVFLSALGSMIAGFANLTWSVAEGLNNLFGLNLSGMGFSPGMPMYDELRSSIVSAQEDAATATDNFNSALAEVTAPLASIEALRNLTSGADGGLNPSSWLVPDAGGDAGGGGGAGSSEQTFAELFSELEEEVNLRRELVGVYGDQRAVIEKIAEMEGELNRTLEETEVLKVEMAVRELRRLEKQEEILNTVHSNIESAFMSLIDGSKSVEQAFREMLFNILAEIYKQSVVQPIADAGSALLSSVIGSLTGTPSVIGAPTSKISGPKPRASGGSIMPGDTYLVGENGPELIVPRHSGTVVNATNTRGSLGGSETVVVNNNINVTGSDAAMVRAEVTKMIPQITEASKAAVINARQRGGQMRATFGG